MPKHEVKLFRTTKEMDKWIMESEYEISKHIVDIILQNMPIESKLLCMRWVNQEENVEYDIELIPEDLKLTLSENLSIMEKYEDYERCSLIKKIITDETING